MNKFHDQYQWFKKNQIRIFPFKYVTEDIKDKVVNCKSTKFYGLARSRSVDHVYQTRCYCFKLKVCTGNNGGGGGGGGFMVKYGPFK